jgi:hypothetical protein
MLSVAPMDGEASTFDVRVFAFAAGGGHMTAKHHGS